ncbi:unnamed protein product [Phytophthora lilii]|uniref:Unnamed protein product n=1 Tax=Phytophthora lilii TaxID=2077276 RepID=A0A9W6YH48_9STRA|nr:unnamed protein product [Phytophthora lilii]
MASSYTKAFCTVYDFCSILRYSGKARNLSHKTIPSAGHNIHPLSLSSHSSSNSPHLSFLLSSSPSAVPPALPFWWSLITPTLCSSRNDTIGVMVSSFFCSTVATSTTRSSSACTFWPFTGDASCALRSCSRTALSSAPATSTTSKANSSFRKDLQQQQQPRVSSAPTDPSPQQPRSHARPAPRHTAQHSAEGEHGQQQQQSVPQALPVGRRVVRAHFHDGDPVVVSPVKLLGFNTFWRVYAYYTLRQIGCTQLVHKAFSNAVVIGGLANDCLGLIAAYRYAAGTKSSQAL